MTRTKVCLGVYLCVLLLVLAAAAQEEVPAAAAPPEVVPEGAVPRLVRFSGVLQTAYGEPRSGLLGVTFALYREQAG
ncbi:MAG TPA: hypothetical protein VNN18_11760, partial [Candidatus Xenobia bacterium]|nr:hypothetical protein [Candidatus Xenobia bacterium]